MLRQFQQLFDPAFYVLVTQQTKISVNLKFGILHLHYMEMLLENFNKHQMKALYKDIQKKSNKLRPMDLINCE